MIIFYYFCKVNCKHVGYIEVRIKQINWNPFSQYVSDPIVVPYTSFRGMVHAKQVNQQ